MDGVNHYVRVEQNFACDKCKNLMPRVVGLDGQTYLYCYNGDCDDYLKPFPMPITRLYIQPHE